MKRYQLTMLIVNFPFFQLASVGEDVLVFYNDHSSFANLLEMMQSERERMDPDSPLNYHINLVTLLACCTEGKNVYTEIKCHSLLPLDDIVRIVTHPDCIPEVSKFSQTLCFCRFFFVLFGTLFYSPR